MKKPIFTIIFCIMLIGCSNNPTDVNVSNELYGTWVFSSYDNGVTVMKRAYQFEDNNSGFHIMSNGGFVERKNSGGCATPPISYTNFDGTWKPKDNNLVAINVGYWGGIQNYDIQIISLNYMELKFTREFINE